MYNAVDCVAPSIEIVDSRINNWDVTLFDTVADNGSSGKLVIGSGVTPIRKVDMRLTCMTMEKNGVLVNSGAAAEVWGNSAAAVAWLINELSRFDMGVKAGNVVLSGRGNRRASGGSGRQLPYLLSGNGKRRREIYLKTIATL